MHNAAHIHDIIDGTDNDVWLLKMNIVTAVIGKYLLAEWREFPQILL
jgi:hypothetical protein